MFSWLNYIWRILATGFCFFCFGIGGLLLSTFIFTPLHLIPISIERKKRYSQNLIHLSFKSFVWLMQATGVIKVTVVGAEMLKESNSHLLIANHPTLIDVVILISLMKNIDCIVKEDLWKNPFLRGVVSAAGYIKNSNSIQLINDTSAAITSGRSLIIFPEGTRTTPGKPIIFHRGAARIAIRSSKDITPVTISCNPISLTKDKKWYQIPRHSKMHLTIHYGKKIAVEPFIRDQAEATIASRKLTQYLQSYFQKELLNNA